MLAGIGIDHLEQQVRVDVVEHRGPVRGADPILAAEHVVVAGLCRPVAIEHLPAPDLLEPSQPLDPCALAPGDDHSGRVRRLAVELISEPPEVRRHPDNGGGLEPIHQLHLPSGVVVTERVHGQSVEVRALLLEPAASEHRHGKREREPFPLAQTSPAEHVRVHPSRAIPLLLRLHVDLLPLTGGAARRRHEQWLPEAARICMSPAERRISDLIS